MGMHRRRLRVVDPCTVFDPSDRVELCAHCHKDVHDLSRMTEAQARRLLSASSGKAICVAYRSRPDGTVVFRPSSMAGWLAACLLLTACTGWGPAEELHLPGDVCFDAAGQQVDCMDPAAGYEIRPEKSTIPSAPSAGSAPDVSTTPDVATATAPSAVGCPVRKHGRSIVESRRVQVEGDSEGFHLRADFALDPDASSYRTVGIVVGVEDPVDRNGPYGRLKFTPTDELWSELAERVRSRRDKRSSDRRSR